MLIRYANGSARLLLAGLLVVLAGCGSAGPRTPVPQAAESSIEPKSSDPAEGSIAPAAADAFRSAVLALENGDLGTAEATLQTLIASWPGYAGPYVNLAIVQRQLGHDDEAEAALTQALLIDPGHPAANNQLGMLQRERGEFAAAEATYRHALVQHPDYALAHYNLAVLLDLYLQRTDEALTHYQRYQELSAEPDPTVGIWIADLSRRLGVAPEPTQLAQGDDS